MKKLRFGLIVIGVFALGCGNKGSGSGAPSAQAEQLGIGACDNYISKMDACFGKMEANMRKAMEPAFQETKSSWKTAAGQGDRARENLKQACEAALASMPATCK